jgi:secondary thiamine-phosphate synthase enzyme
MIKRFEVKTTAAAQMIDITAQVKGLVRAQDMSSGMIVVYVPHTTCAVTINENADPDVKEDIIENLERLVPSSARYKHGEGNSHAHIKASLIGASVNIFVESTTLVLGTWQGIFLAEFDGPRQRSVLVKFIPD